MIRAVLSLDALRHMSPDEAAALLLVRQDAGEDGLDDAVFDEWLMADPAHAEAWTRACGAWESFSAAPEDAALQAIRDEARAESPARPRWGWAMAASVALVAATSGLFVASRNSGVGTSPPTVIASAGQARRILATSGGRPERFALADKSTVVLDSDSAVAVAFRPDGERRIELLRGQAYFIVAHDRTRPFVVAANGRTVTALGTEFEVRSDRGAMRVVLVEGRVSVAGAAVAPVLLRPGQQLTARADGGMTVSPADVAAVRDWQLGVVTFDNTPVAVAAAELNRHSRLQLVVDDPHVARLTVSGVFRTDDPRRFARTLAEIYPVRVVSLPGDRIAIVSRKGR